MWLYENDTINGIPLSEINLDLIRRKMFFFIGKRCSVQNIDYDKILRTFDELLDMYRFVEEKSNTKIAYKENKVSHLSSESRANVPDQRNNKTQDNEYYCRICWNRTGWVRPSGGATEDSDTFYSQYGFGHEEWLLNFLWMVDDYHYSYLQPIGKGYESKIGKVLSIILYTFSPDGPILIGKISNCQIINRDEAISIKNEYKKNGWLEEMCSHLKSLNLPIDSLNKDDIFNIKFRQEDFHPFFPVTIMNDELAKKGTRYQLIPNDSNLPINIPKFQNNYKSEESTFRRAIRETTIDPLHSKIQNSLVRYLKKRHPGCTVLYEDDFVDVKLIDKQSVNFYEIKTDVTARGCIRAALGQLMDYSYYPKDDKATKLYVVGEVRAKEMDIMYLNNLNIKFNLPLRYIQYDKEHSSIKQEVGGNK